MLPGRRARPSDSSGVDVYSACACQIEGWDCRHYSNLPELPLDPAPADPARAVTVGVHVRPYHRDNHGWEVVTTDWAGSPAGLSGRYQTAEEAEEVRELHSAAGERTPGAPRPELGPAVAGRCRRQLHTAVDDHAPTVGISVPPR